MKSEMAAEDLEEMREQGLNPSVDDIIRLNALGLKVELNPSSGEYYALPRVSYLGNLTFREPTIGHAMWIDSVSRYISDSDLSSIVAVEAYALSRPHTSLPDHHDRKLCVKLIDEFTKGELAHFTLKQVHCAVVYAMHGGSAVANEFPVRAPDAPKLADDVAVSIGAGVMVETLSMGLGLSVRDISFLTISQVRAIQEAGFARQGINISKSNRTTALAGYEATKFDIINRLKAEASAVKE